MLTNDQDDRIAHFLSIYVIDANTGGVLPAHPAYIKDAIGLILDKGVMTEKEMKREALKDWNVIIPAAYYSNGGTHGQAQR